MAFEPTIPAFERAKTVHALDRAATISLLTHLKLLLYMCGPIEKTVDSDVLEAGLVNSENMWRERKRMALTGQNGLVQTTGPVDVPTQ
jgi:hypothetical protein